jgi:hypothetical protein
MEAFALEGHGCVTPGHCKESLASGAAEEVKAERCNSGNQKVSGNDENGNGHLHLMEDLQEEKKRQETPGGDPMG